MNTKIFDLALTKKPKTFRCGITKSRAGHYHVYANDYDKSGYYMRAKCSKIYSLGAAQETVQRVTEAIKKAKPENQADFRAAFQSACFTGEY